MVYGAGNYKTMEFIKYGAGLKVRDPSWTITASIMKYGNITF